MTAAKINAKQKAMILVGQNVFGSGHLGPKFTERAAVVIVAVIGTAAPPVTWTEPGDTEQVIPTCNAPAHDVLTVPLKPAAPTTVSGNVAVCPATTVWVCTSGEIFIEKSAAPAN